MHPTLQTPLSDQIARIHPLWVVLFVSLLLLIRVILASGRQSWGRALSENVQFVIGLLLFNFLLLRPFVAQAFYVPTGSMLPTIREYDRILADRFSYRLGKPARGETVVFYPPREAIRPGDEDTPFVKRLIGLPGDTVEVRAARLWIGGEAVHPAAEGLASLHDLLRARLGFDAAALKLFPEYVRVDGARRIPKTEIARAFGRPGGTPVTIRPGETLVNGRTLYEPYTREDPGYAMAPRRVGEDELFLMGDNRNNSFDSHVWGPIPRGQVVGRARFVFWPLSRAGTLR